MIELPWGPNGIERPWGQRGNVECPGWAPGQPDGRPSCCWCFGPVERPRRSWCSDECVHQYRLRGDWNYLRAFIVERDRVCRICEGVSYKPRYGIWGLGTGDPPRSELVEWMEVDHIVTVHDGGTDEPSNLRLLCRRCHKEVTAAWHRARALARRPQTDLFPELLP